MVYQRWLSHISLIILIMEAPETWVQTCFLFQISVDAPYPSVVGAAVGVV